MADAPTTQYFITPDGQLKAVGASSLGVAHDSGWTPVGSDLEQAKQARETGSWTGMAKQLPKAAAAGAFDAVTGLPRLATAGIAAATGGKDALEHVSGNQFLEDLSAVGHELAGAGTAEAAGRQFKQQRQLEAKVNPGTETGGYIAGQVAGTIASGGGSLAGEAGTAVKGALGGGFLARSAARAASGFIEGAPMGMTQAQHDAYVEGRHLTAEQSFADGMMGGVLGAGLGVGAGAAGEGLSKVFGKVKEGATALAEKAQGLAEKAGTPEGRAALRDLAGTSDEAVANTIKSSLGEDLVSPEVVQHARDGFAGKNLAVVRAETEGAAAREVRSSLNQMETSTKNLSPEWQEAKPANVAKTIARDEASVASQSEIVQNQLGTIRERMNAMLNDPVANAEGQYGYKAALHKVEQSVQRAERKAMAALESGKMEDAFTALDTLKRDMGPLGRKTSQNSADQATVAEVHDLYEGLRQGLEHDAWGNAGQMQKNVNAAFTEWKSTEDIFGRQFMTETGREGWRPTRAADPGKIEPYIGGLGQARNDLKHAIVEQHVEATEKLGKALAAAGELTPEKAAELKAIVDSANKFRATIANVQKKVSAIDQAQNFIATTTGSQGVFSGATIAGSVLGGLPGAVVGGALEKIMNPGKALAQKLKFEAMAIKTADRMKAGLDNFFEKMGTSGVAAKAKAAAQTVGEGAQAVGRTARTAAVPSALGAFGQIAKTPELAFEKRRDEILTASNDNNGGVRKAMAAQFGELANQDPHGFAGAVLTASNALDFLRGKMPAGGPDPQSLTPMTSQLQPSKVEIQEWAEVWNAINDPVSIVEALADGDTPNPDAIEAISVVHPRMYQSWQMETMTRLRQMDSAGEEVPIRQRMHLDTFLNLNGAGEPAFAPDFGAKHGPMIGAPMPDQGAPPGRKGGMAGGVGKRLQTQTLSMIQ